MNCEQAESMVKKALSKKRFTHTATVRAAAGAMARQ